MFYKLIDDTISDLFCIEQEGQLLLSTKKKPRWNRPTNNIELFNQMNLMDSDFVPFGLEFNSLFFDVQDQFHPSTSVHSNDTIFALIVLHAASHLIKYSGTFNPLDFGIDLLVLDMEYQDITPELRREGMEFLMYILKSVTFEMLRVYPEHIMFLRYIIIKTYNPEFLPYFQGDEMSFVSNLAVEVKSANVMHPAYMNGDIPIVFSYHSEWKRFQSYLHSERFDLGFAAMFKEHDVKNSSYTNPDYYN
jgi:hypothetical protein